MSHEGFFYLIDGKKNILKLTFQKDSHNLIKDKTLSFKDVEKVNFKYIPFGRIIVNDKYVIQESKIFYVQDDQQLEAGIHDMEELEDLKDKTAGPNEKSSLVSTVNPSMSFIHSSTSAFS